MKVTNNHPTSQLKGLGRAGADWGGLGLDGAGWGGLKGLGWMGVFLNKIFKTKRRGKDGVEITGEGRGAGGIQKDIKYFRKQ